MSLVVEPCLRFAALVCCIQYLNTSPMVRWGLKGDMDRACNMMRRPSCGRLHRAILEAMLTLGWFTKYCRARPLSVAPSGQLINLPFGPAFGYGSPDRAVS